MIVVTVTHGFFTRQITDAGTRTTIERSLLAIDDLRFAAPTFHGGWVRWEYGTITIAPEFFSVMDPTDQWWPPPQVLEQLTISWIDDAGTITPFPGEFSAWRQEVRRDGVVYELRERDAYDSEVLGAQYRGTLTAVFSDACTDLGLTLNSTYARATPPAVDWVSEGTSRLLDNLDAIARFFSHRFWISGGTLYLADCLRDYGSGATLPFSALADVAYPSLEPVSKFTADYTPSYVTKIALYILSREGGGTDVAIAEVDIAPSVGAALVHPTATSALPTDSGSSAAYLADNNTATYWYSGLLAVPGAFVYVASSGPIKEYAIQARNNAITYAPRRWELIGYCPYRDQYLSMGEFESTGWGALETRRFSVPQVNWPVELTNPISPAGSTPGEVYASGETYQMHPACQRDYNLIAAHLANCKTLRNQPRTRITVPMQAVSPGQRITISNVPLTEDGGKISSWFRVESCTYNASEWTITLEGPGNLS